MSKSIIVDRVKVVAEMARQNLTTEELSLKAGVGRNAFRMAVGWPVMVRDALGLPAINYAYPH